MKYTVLSLLLLLLLGGCGDLFNSNRPPPQDAYPQPSMYPHAQGVTLDKTHPEVRYIEFDTTDSVADVFGFYDQELLPNGWRYSNFDSPEPKTRRDYIYVTKPRTPKVEGDVFKLFVFATPTSNGLTHVKLTFGVVGPGYIFPSDYKFPPGFN